jgi:HSP20 family protein
MDPFASGFPVLGLGAGDMSDTDQFRLRQLHGRLGDLMIQFTKVNFAHSPAPEAWTPAVNAYRCEVGFAICVELAGVAKEGIELEIAERKLSLRGRREIPEPKGKGEEPTQILAMEIDAGPFAREITLPAEVEATAVRAEQKDGYLWVYLPFRSHS